VTVSLVASEQWKWKRQQIAVSISIIIAITRLIEKPFHLHHRSIDFLSADITKCIFHQTNSRQRTFHQAISD